MRSSGEDRGLLSQTAAGNRVKLRVREESTRGTHRPHKERTPVYDICRLQTADRIDKESNKENSGTSSSTAFPAQNNINLVAKILIDFLWWFTVMVLDSM